MTKLNFLESARNFATGLSLRFNKYDLPKGMVREIMEQGGWRFNEHYYPDFITNVHIGSIWSPDGTLTHDNDPEYLKAVRHARAYLRAKEGDIPFKYLKLKEPSS